MMLGGETEAPLALFPSVSHYRPTVALSEHATSLEREQGDPHRPTALPHLNPNMVLSGERLEPRRLIH